MRVLVTGANGRLGGPILRSLHQAGHQVRALVRSGLPERDRGAVDEVLRGDVREQRTWRRALPDMDAVLHLAYTPGNSQRAFDENISTVRIMSRACAEAEVDRVVFASADAALGHRPRPGHRAFGFDFFPVDEDHPLKCETDFGLAKAVGEQILAAAARRWGLHIYALRLAPVWDEARCALRRHQDSSSEEKHKETLWSWLHEEDCARAFTLALAQDFVPGTFEPLYICASDTTADTPTRGLVQAHFPHLMERCTLRDHQSFFSWRRALELLGFVPAYSWRPSAAEPDDQDEPEARRILPEPELLAAL